MKSLNSTSLLLLLFYNCNHKYRFLSLPSWLSLNIVSALLNSKKINGLGKLISFFAKETTQFSETKWTNHKSGSSVCGVANEINVAYGKLLISMTKHSLLGIKTKRLEVYT